MVQITKRQTTFWDLRIDNAVQRVHFRGKKEYKFVSPEAATFEIVDDHPVLLDHRHPWQQVALAGRTDNPRLVLDQLTQRTAEIVGPWRDLSNYLNPGFPAEEILTSGYGILLEAPGPLIVEFGSILRNLGVRFTTLPRRRAQKSVKAFIVGLNFVVAEHFDLDHNSGAA